MQKREQVDASHKLAYHSQDGAPLTAKPRLQRKSHMLRPSSRVFFIFIVGILVFAIGRSSVRASKLVDHTAVR
jgi:uncharacterized protein YqhQ